MSLLGTKFLIDRIDRALDQRKIPTGLLRFLIDRDPDASEYLQTMIELEDRLIADSLSSLFSDSVNQDSDLADESFGFKPRLNRIDRKKRIRIAGSRMILVSTAAIIVFVLGISLIFHSKSDQIARKSPPSSVQNPLPIVPTSEKPNDPDRLSQFGQYFVKPDELLDTYPLLLISPEISALLLKTISESNFRDHDLTDPPADPFPKNESSVSDPSIDSEIDSQITKENLFHEIMDSNPFSAHLMEYYIAPVFASREIP